MRPSRGKTDGAVCCSRFSSLTAVVPARAGPIFQSRSWRMPPTGDDDHIDRIRYRCAVRSGHDKETMPWQQPSPRSRPPAFPICRRWRVSNLQPPPPASAMVDAPTCCWPCSSRARALPASSRGRNVRPPRSIGAARILRPARRARSWSIPATPMPLPANPAARRPSSPRTSPPEPPAASRRMCSWHRPA